MNKQDQNVINNVTTNLSQSMRTEGTSGSPRKFTLVEIAERVASAFIVSPNEELESMVCEIVTEELRKLGRIKKEKSAYNFAQSFLSYRVLDNKSNSGLVGSIYHTKKYVIELTEEEHKLFCESMNPPSEDNKTWTIVKGLKKEAKNGTCSPNYGDSK